MADRARQHLGERRGEGSQLRERDDVRHGPVVGRHGLPAEPRAELILAQQKIGEKVWDGHTWVKFPGPAPGRYHVILADMRGTAITGGDYYDYAQLAYGPKALSREGAALVVRYRGEPVLGLLDPTTNRLRSAATVRERIHFLGFCNDAIYDPGSIRRSSLYLANPNLLAFEDATAALRQFALRE